MRGGGHGYDIISVAQILNIVAFNAALRKIAGIPLYCEATRWCRSTWMCDLFPFSPSPCMQVAARLASPFTRYRKYDPERQGLMKDRLLRMVSTPGLSENVYEIVSKSLE